MTEPQVEGPESGEQSETPEPWAPEGTAKIGTAPSRDGDGERGTSAYDGDGPSDERGPLPGVENYSNDPNYRENQTGHREHVRESARKDG